MTGRCRSHSRLPRRLALTVILAGTTVLPVTVPTTIVAAKAPFDAIPDGDWQGGMVFKTGATFGDFETGGNVFTSFATTIDGGQVTGGEVDFVAKGQSADGDGSYAQLDLNGEGAMTGPATAPVMVLDSLLVSGTAGVQGIDIDVHFVLGADELQPLELELYTATCEKATGTVEQTIADNVASAGGTGFVFNGSWNLYREGSAPPDPEGTLDDLLLRAMKLLVAAEAGASVDPAEVLAVVSDAEDFDAALLANEACRAELGGDDPSWALSIAPVIRDLIAAAIASSNSWGLGELQAVVQAGIRSNVFNLAGGDDLSIQLEAIFLARLSAAEQAGATSDIQQILLTAAAMGWEATIEAAIEALQ